MNKSSFKTLPLVLGLLGIFWGLSEFMMDVYLVRQSTYSMPSLTMLMFHITMGSILGFLMMFAYLKSRNAKDKYIKDLYSSEERYRMLFEDSPLGIIHFDQTGKITQSNDKFIEILDSSRENIIGFNMITQSGDVDMKLAIESSLLGKVGCYEGTYTSVTTGRTLPLKAIFNRVTSDNGELIGGMGIFEDISEKKQLEKEMARLDRLDLVGQMSASIGHEIRNPMTTVRGFLQLLGNREPDPVKKDYYEVMINELDRANMIITEFLSLAKNKLVRFENASINDIIDSIYPLILVDSLKHDHNFTVHKGVIPNLQLDEREIRQLILNLVRNGLESMSKGKNLTIRTYTAGDELVLSVQDEGSGINADIQDKIGTPFLTTKEKGTGLGLPVCYSIAERHQAKIDFKTGSTGTTFFVRFKIPKCQADTKRAS